MKNFFKKTLLPITIWLLMLSTVMAWWKLMNRSNYDVVAKRILFTVTGTGTDNPVLDTNSGGNIIAYGPLLDWSGNLYVTWITETDPIRTAASWNYIDMSMTWYRNAAGVWVDTNSGKALYRYNNSGTQSPFLEYGWATFGSIYRKWYTGTKYYWFTVWWGNKNSSNWNPSFNFWRMIIWHNNSITWWDYWIAIWNLNVINHSYSSAFWYKLNSAADYQVLLWKYNIWYSSWVLEVWWWTYEHTRDNFLTIFNDGSTRLTAKDKNWAQYITWWALSWYAKLSGYAYYWPAYDSSGNAYSTGAWWTTLAWTHDFISKRSGSVLVDSYISNSWNDVSINRTDGDDFTITTVWQINRNRPQDDNDDYAIKINASTNWGMYIYSLWTDGNSQHNPTLYLYQRNFEDLFQSFGYYVGWTWNGGIWVTIDYLWKLHAYQWIYDGSGNAYITSATWAFCALSGNNTLTGTQTIAWLLWWAALNQNGSVTWDFTVNRANGNFQSVVIASWTYANPLKMTFSNALVGEYTLKLIQDSTKTGMIDRNNNTYINFKDGIFPLLSTQTGAVDIIKLFYDGTNRYGYTLFTDML